MQIDIVRTIKQEVDAIRCVLPVRYGVEDIPLDFPGRVGDTLTLVLDLDTRKVRDWPTDHDQARDVYMKVCDEGSYYLLFGDVAIAAREQEYVPACIPGEYGDYVTLRIEVDGKLFHCGDGAGKPWVPNPRAIAECFGVAP